MARDVRVHLLPSLFEPEELRGGVAVVVDVLRASTTIIHALANGAKCVIPALDVETARNIACGVAPRAEVLLGGEREGVLIPGFDLDNNPFAYTEEVVNGKTIVFTTTNGTAALQRAALADRVLIGALLNIQAVVRELVNDERPVHFVCAGTKGRITLEDALCAGVFVHRLALSLRVSSLDWTDDQLQLSLGLFRSILAQSDHRPVVSGSLADVFDSLQKQTEGAVEQPSQNRSPDPFLEAMRNSYGGRNCQQLGFDDQIVRAASPDIFDIVPEYNPRTGRIVCAP